MVFNAIYVAKPNNKTLEHISTQHFPLCHLHGRCAPPGHVDMVTEKNSGSTHDFLKDPIRLLVEGDWLTADGTTLGADNGIGVAAALTLLDCKMRPSCNRETWGRDLLSWFDWSRGASSNGVDR